MRAGGEIRQIMHIKTPVDRSKVRDPEPFAAPPWHGFKTARMSQGGVRDKKSRAKLLVLLGIIWVVVTLPLPWVVGNPDIPESQVYTVLGIIGIISVPFVMLAAVWTLRPELAR
jgi:hypothetical protein